ncbi:ATP-dependent DNA helicase Q1-like [Mytilus trossulus]|uniref:ATP-dependent DNA helicase Q1-like n=1 Tax=Mytilus trossulus TaxID=6551 RepID=UPI003007EC60
MDVYRKELAETKKELETISIEIDSLLQRQASLQQRKTELDSILRQSSAKSDDNDKKWDKQDFEWSNNLLAKMGSVFNIQTLRPMQLQTMNVTMSCKDCMLIMPTGGGKSLCFQLPALLSKGITLVVSPLVSLMEDQIMALERYGIDATKLDASASKEKVKAVQEAMLDKNASLKLLYVTPEKLAKSKRFMAKLEKMYQAGRFSRLVIDEVHCCSQWGHDFRPDYKFLGIMKRQFPEVPILGLTATATTKVLEDVKKILNIPNCHLFKASFNRPNLFYEVKAKPSAFKETISEMVELIDKRFRNQSGIVYCFTQKESEEVSRELRQHGIKTGCYHASIPAKQKSQIHEMWLADKILVIVATVAFGMGIDKPNVRFVIHHSISKSMENLYQESGRAGRDEQRSDCIVYYRFADVFKQSTMVFTEQTGLDNVYGVMSYCLDISKCRRASIARHFGELWDKSQCNKMCDHCNKDTEGEKRDVTKLGLNVLTIIDQASATDQRITALKLLDAWEGKGAGSLKVRGLDPPKVSRDKLERIIGHMLLQGFIREDFHFTPYSTISYLVAGAKANLLKSESAKLAVEFLNKRKSLPTQNSNTDNSPSSQSDHIPPAKQNDTKPKLVVINSENSKFSNFTGTSINQSSQDENDFTKTKKSGKLKRKKPVINDSDSDDLDFGEEFKRKPAMKKKSSTRSSKSEHISGSQSNNCSNSESLNGNLCESNEAESGDDSDVIIENVKKSKAIMIDSE